MAATLLSRVRSLNKAFTPARLPAARGPVVLVLDRDQRLVDNWAVTYAQDAAKTLAVPLVVAFASEPSVGTTLRAWSFALRGVAEVQRACDAVGIPFVLLHGTAAQTAGRFAIEQGASLLVTDFSPLRADRAWRASVAAELERAAPAIGACEVDAHNVVPVWLASDKLEYAARTLRPRLMRQLPAFLVEYPPVAKQSPDAWRPAAGKPVSGGAAAGAESPLRWTSGASIDWEAALATASLDRSVAPVSWATPGHEAGTAALRAFLAVSRLTAYAESRNNPTLSATSGLSPWLHFGHISPARAALEAYKVRNATAPKAPSAKVIAGVDSFVEELVVRRELSDNFCHYNVRYDDLDGLYPQFGNDSWAQRTLRDHVGDKREYVYSESELERGKTHDALWNAAQLEMVRLGKMHGFMRMYWAKKILEWSASPADALRVAIALNDKYELDGRDPNGYVGCAWSVAGVHDQGWAERPVFGKIRYMNYNGCRTKFAVDKYIAAIKVLARSESAAQAASVGAASSTSAASAGVAAPVSQALGSSDGGAEALEGEGCGAALAAAGSKRKRAV